MTETGVPYQAGEQPAEQKSLGEIAHEGWLRHIEPKGYPRALQPWWTDLDEEQQQERTAMAAAVEAEVLRRLYDHMRARQAEVEARHPDNQCARAAYGMAVCDVGLYAAQRKQEGQT